MDDATGAPTRCRNITPNTHFLWSRPPRSGCRVWHPHCSPMYRRTRCSESDWKRKEPGVPIERRDVMFKSGETFAAAWLFMPEQARSDRRVPAVAMAHGIGYVKEMYLEPFARRFAAAGIAALALDFRGFGGSGGEPRQRVFPQDQMEDYRNALTWLSLQPEIDADRLGIWGTSFSGGHVVQVAAHDPRVKAVVSQTGAMDLNQIMRGIVGPEQFTGLQQLTVQERIRHAVEG